ncbi:alpha-amylase family glycosyl hydrolase [Cyanobium sp. WAJ14-Wanaka]|uniref:alpha-amylase family glycosyl hydrolase n=1 Tax=Cyanobium sp. WAJ14-Wanaka TaxID=2823725 RepID=UPI0020CD70EF|nr:alpha-amylase family glycosyl hydrolase [Cyanobium sp. WAJ14-Wanaka]MCP9775920.1 cyclomaltodextrin glucanotransferase [Cyanobium sp. WAJ14-Wanaka]
MEWGKYWGGNLQGIIDKVEYLKALGVTAVWLSPLFEQVDDMQFNRAPMHGYWARDFKRINPRFLPQGESASLGSSETLKRLVETLHDSGIKLILDVVCNHSSPDINGSKGIVLDDGKPFANFHSDEANLYHHNPEITDWQDEYQLINHEMCGLATFNENNINFRNYIKDAIKAWIDIGVDALRVDTLKHMPLWFWQEFTIDIKRHKPEIFLFGEYGFSKPWDQRSVAYANHSGMSILDFGLCDAIRFAFSNQQPGGFKLIEKVLAMDEVYKRANELVTFIDNHDMPRFLSIVSDSKKLDLALVLLMTLRGVPCLFYGTEQYLHNNTDGGEDPYNRPMMECWDQNSRPYQLISRLVQLRRTNQSLTMGNHQQRYVDQSLYAFSRHYRDSHVLVILNQGSATQISLNETGLPNGLHTCKLTGEVLEQKNGLINNVAMPEYSARVFSVEGLRVQGQVVGVFQLNGYHSQPGQRIAITGSCPELGEWDHSLSYGMEYVNSNTWIAEVAFNASAGVSIAFKFVVMNQNRAEVIENIVSRNQLLPNQGRIKLDCIWNDD